MADKHKQKLQITSRAEVTKAAVKAKPTATPKKPFTFADEHQMLTQEQIDVMNLPVEDIISIGAKGGGKSYKGTVRLVTHMEHNYRASGLALKKYKTNATKRLHDLISNTVGKIRAKGFTIPDYEKGQSETYRMVKKLKQSNQSIEYLSFEDYESFAGIVAANNGYFPLVLIEEPVEMNDKNPCPSEEEFWNMMDAIKDSIGRVNADYMSLSGIEVEPTKYYYTMNPWDDHPLIVYGERVFPESEFTSWALEDLFNNHTKVVIDKKNNRAVERTTKFAKPQARIIDKTCYDLEINNLEDLATKANLIDFDAEIFKKYNIILKHFEMHISQNKGTIYQRAMEALRMDNRHELTVILGLKDDTSGVNKKTYVMDNLETADTFAILRNATAISPLYFSWDIDHRRRLVLTANAVVWKQNDNFTKAMNILTFPQRTFEVEGVGNNGEKLEYISEKMLRYQEELASDILANMIHIRKVTGIIKVSIDDNFRHYLSIMGKKESKQIYSYSLAQKHGAWDIKHRTNWTNAAFDMSAVIIDSKNKQLLSDLEKSVILEGQDQRCEKGVREKDYDFINSWEYSIYWVKSLLNAENDEQYLGKVSDYIKE